MKNETIIPVPYDSFMDGLSAKAKVMRIRDYLDCHGDNIDAGRLRTIMNTELAEPLFVKAGGE